MTNTKNIYMKHTMQRFLFTILVLFITGNLAAQSAAERNTTPAPNVETNYPRPATPEENPIKISNVKILTTASDKGPGTQASKPTGKGAAEAKEEKVTGQNQQQPAANGKP